MEETQVEKYRQRYWPVGCGCCAAPPEFIRLTNEHHLYGKKYSKYKHAYIWICTKCKAYVGCHKDTPQPKGTLADKQTRIARRTAHHWFDPIWKYYEKVRKWDRQVARNRAYEWLAEELEITRVECHIGHFDVNTCLKVAKICEEAIMKSKPLKTYYLNLTKSKSR